MDNTKKVALVIGGTTGIGYGVAKKLCTRNILTYVVGRRSVDFNDNMYNKNLIHIQVDLLAKNAIDKIISSLENDQLDFIIVSAATETPLKSFLNISQDDFDHAFYLNLKIHFFLIQAIVRKQKLAHAAKILILSSRLATEPEAGSLIYGMTKAAIDNFAQGLQIELGTQFLVSAIKPGIVDTEMQKRLRDETSADFKHQKLYKQMKSKLQSIDQVSDRIVDQMLL